MRTAAGYDAALLTVRADTADGLAESLEEVTNLVLEKVVDVNNLLQSVAVAKAPAPAAGATQTQAGAAQPAAPEVKTCTHGVRQYKTGNGAKGAWAGWFCPTPKGTADQCKPVWKDD